MMPSETPAIRRAKSETPQGSGQGAMIGTQPALKQFQTEAICGRVLVPFLGAV